MPSWTATTLAFAEPVSSTVWIFGAACAIRAAAATAGELAVVPCAAGASGVAGCAPAVAFDGVASAGSAPHSKTLPSIGGRPSTSPVRVAITGFG